MRASSPLTTELKAMWHQCVLCQEHTILTVCELCESDVDFIQHTLLRQNLCAVNDTVTDEYLEHDAILNAKFDELWILGVYHYPLTYLIPALKFHGQRHFATLLAQWFVLYRVKYMTDLPQVIIPVPLHWRRFLQRGYNQAELIAQTLSQHLHIPIDKTGRDALVKRRRYTKPQSELNQEQRCQNMQHVFSVNPHAIAQYQHVVIVDDVMTTGGTINDLCRAIYRHAPHIKISVWCIGLSTIE